MPARATLFRSNRSQAVRLPKEVAFPEGVKRVIVRKVGNTRVITPVDQLWDDFFDAPGVPDFPEREPQPPMEEREPF